MPMSKQVWILILRFVLLILLQVLLVDRLALNGYIVPRIYLLIVLMLPLDSPAWFVLLISFMSGFVVDIFSNTGAMQMMATVLIGFIRPFVVSLIAPVEGYDSEDKPHVFSLGYRWFLIYAGILTLLHHLAYFSLEIMSLSYPGYLIKKIVFTSLLSLLVMILLQSLFIVSRHRNRYN